MKKSVIYGLGVLAMAFGLTPGLRAETTVEVPTTIRAYSSGDMGKDGGVLLVSQNGRTHLFGCKIIPVGVSLHESLEKSCVSFTDYKPTADWQTTGMEMRRLADGRFIYLGAVLIALNGGYANSIAEVINFDPKNPEVLLIAASGLMQPPNQNPVALDMKVMTAKKSREESLNYPELHIPQKDI